MTGSVALQQFSDPRIASTRPVARRARLSLGTCLGGAASALLLAAVPALAQDAAHMTAPRGTHHEMSGRAGAQTSPAAEPQDLTVHFDDDAAIVTQDDVERGITLTNFTGAGLLIDAADVDAAAYDAITVKEAAMNPEGAKSGGIQALVDGDIVIDAGTVETHGYRIDGIYANNNAGGYSGSIKISADSVTTTGEASAGIRALAYDGSTEVKVGSVKTSGFGSDGIYGWSYSGDTKIESDSVTTSGDGGRGITAYSGGTTTVIADEVMTTGAGTSPEFHAGGITAVGAAVVVKAGTVSTKGDFSSGIYASSNLVHDNGQVDRDIRVTADSISTEGLASHGVVAISAARRAEIDIDVGDVRTGGDYAVGIYALAPTGSISVKADNVDTRSLQSIGIVGISNYGDIAIDAGSISTSGDGAVGVYAYSGGAPRTGTTATNIHVGAITTSGGYASGVVAIGASEGAAIAIDVGSIATEGIRSRGVVAYGMGDMTVTAGAIATKGLGANGIEAFGFAGDIAISAGSVTTDGDLATAIYASSLSGAVKVEAGDIATLGIQAQGVRAYSQQGDVSVVGNGDVHTAGGRSYGLLAFGGGNITIDNVGSVETHGEFAHGLYALGRGEGVTSVSNGGTVTVTGLGASAIRALGAKEGGGIKVISTGAINALGEYTSGVVAVIPRSRDGGGLNAPGVDIDVTTVTVTGDETTGILGLNYSGDVHIRTGSVNLSGKGLGVSVIAAGSTDVEVGSIKSGGRGVVLISGGATTLTVTENIVAPDHFAVALGSGSGPAVLNVAKGATVIGGGKRNPDDGNYTGPGNAVILSSDTKAVVNNDGSIRNLGDRYTIFVADRYVGDWEPIPAGGSLINNSGTLEGNLRLTAGEDVMINSGVFEATKDSLFGGGEDRFENSGVVRIGTAAITTSLAPAAAPTRVTFHGLDRFHNSGKIDMRNGIAGDQLVLTGAFIGSGASTLALDIGGASADQLVVEGAATGSTNVMVATLPGKATLFAGPVAIIKVGEGSAPDAFKLDENDTGFIRYDIGYDSASRTYSLGTQVGSSAYRLAKLTEGTQAIWDKSTQAWSTHMAELRDAGSGGHRLWGQMFGGVVDRGGDLDSAPLDYRQDFFGAQLGYDIGGSEAEDSSALFGVTGGYLSSNQRFEGGNERAEFSVLNLAGYGSYRGKHVFANLIGQYNRFWIDARGGVGSQRWSDDVGGDAYGVQGEVGVRMGSETFFAEPVATLAWQTSSIGAIEAFGHRIEFKDTRTVTGKIGARIGASVGGSGASKAVLYARGNYVHAFSGRAGLLFSSGGVSQSIVTPRAGDYGEAAIGLNILSQGPVSGFFEGDAILGRDAKGGGGRLGIRFKF